ncbi:MAG: C4-dicarboxylate ABC transporter substrate-binding protein, partial [Treponema sp.]|nr:C4-dicarboxylate ABC transporter substrate-binding protein [Treponema sp.]
MKPHKTLFVSALILAFCGTSLFMGCKKTETVRMATGGNTGTYYAFGSAVGQILTGKTNVPITIQSTGAS